MDWFWFSVLGVVAIEIGILWLMYSKVFAKMNAEKWEEKVREDDGTFLLDILAPVIDETVFRILDSAPKELTKVLKGELLASQGSLTRAVMHEQGEPADMMVGISTAIFEQLGWKNVNPLMALKLSSILSGILEKVGETQEAPVEYDIPTGADIYSGKSLF